MGKEYSMKSTTIWLKNNLKLKMEDSGTDPRNDIENKLKL